MGMRDHIGPSDRQGTQITTVETFDSRELARRNAGFGKVAASTVMLRSRSNTATYPRIFVAAAGGSGYGKSSTINALLGTKAMHVSHVDAGTKSMQSVDVKLRTGSDHLLSFVDMPGISESQSADLGYAPMYEWMASRASAILYFVKADERTLAHHQRTFERYFKSESVRRRVILVMSAADLAEPIQPYAQELSASQRDYLARRERQVRETLLNGTTIPVSARLNVGIEELAAAATNLLLWPEGSLV